MTATIHDITDHGIWRGKHRWTIIMEDEHGRSSVEATGDDVHAAILDASHTFDNRLAKRLTGEEKSTMRRTNEVLQKRLIR